jgi:glycosyltransferase involved in cell wall biosynthesis
VSDAVRERLVTQYAYPGARTVTVVNGINVDHYGLDRDPDRPLRLELGIAPDIPVVLCVASLVKQKRVDLLLDALARLKAAGTPCVCVIAGEGPLRTALTEQACRLELAECVRFVGFVKDIRPYLQASDLFVMSSDKEGCRWRCWRRWRRACPVSPRTLAATARPSCTGRADCSWRPDPPTPWPTPCGMG